MQNGANLLRSLNKQPSSRLFLYKIASCLHDCAAVSLCHVTVKQLKMWSQETVHGNRINLEAREKVLNSHLMLNYSDLLFIYLFILSHRY